MEPGRGRGIEREETEIESENGIEGKAETEAERTGGIGDRTEEEMKGDKFILPDRDIINFDIFNIYMYADGAEGRNRNMDGRGLGGEEEATPLRLRER